MGFFSDDEDEDLAILDALSDEEKEITKKEDYDAFDFDDETEDEDDYYSEDED